MQPQHHALDFVDAGFDDALNRSFGNQFETLKAWKFRRNIGIGIVIKASGIVPCDIERTRQDINETAGIAHGGPTWREGRQTIEIARMREF